MIFGGVGAGLYGMLDIRGPRGVQLPVSWWDAPPNTWARRSKRKARDVEVGDAGPHGPLGDDPGFHGVGRRLRLGNRRPLTTSGPHGFSEILYGVQLKRRQQRERVRRPDGGAGG